MDETENFVKFIKEKFPQNEIMMAKFIIGSDILSYTMETKKEYVEGKGKEDTIVEKPTNILDMSYLKLCAKKFDDSENIFEKMFLFYIGYALREYKNTWKLNLNNLDKDIISKCSYCNLDSKTCPFKLATYIQKCIDDNKFDSYRVGKLLAENDVKEYSQDQYAIGYITTSVNDLIKNSMDIVAAAMTLECDAVKLVREENGNLVYKYFDFQIKNDSLFNALNEFYKGESSKDGVINLNNIEFSDCDSYLFTKSPIELAAYIKYLCERSNVSEKEVFDNILSKRNFKESEFRSAYYNQYVNEIRQLECPDNEKEDIISILNYIKNYYFNEDLPYIHFNVALFTKNSIISEQVIHIISRFARTFNYIGNKGTLWVDSEMLVKRTNDSKDMLSNVDKMYSDNDVVIFENIENVKKLNEYRVDAMFTAIEKFNTKNRKSITFFVEKEDIFRDITKKHPSLIENTINKKIHIDGFDVKEIKNKLLKRLEFVTKVDDEFSEEIEEYIRRTYNPEVTDEYIYIDNLYNKIVFEKYNSFETSTKFQKEDVPQEEDTREVSEILADINGLVGLADVKNNINELIKYLEYSKKIGVKGFENLNMILKGNSGTGKTTVARLLAELFYKLGFIKENKIIEVTSKDLIGSHLGETAPKTQEIIDTAIGGVLFIDEAYTIMASKGSSSSNYPAECMATICKAMEVNKDNLIVMFAGYTRRNERFYKC